MKKPQHTLIIIILIIFLIADLVLLAVFGNGSGGTSDEKTAQNNDGILKCYEGNAIAPGQTLDPDDEDYTRSDRDRIPQGADDIDWCSLYIHYLLLRTVYG